MQINQDAILVKFLKSESVQRKVSTRLYTKVEKAKEALLEEFDSSPVTKEIEAGPDLAESQILPGGYGNLFSFLGFERGTDPITPVRQLLDKIYMVRKPVIMERYWKFTIRTPSETDFEREAPMTWESGRSWVEAVTHGLSGFSHYMFSLKEGRFKGSRSSTGTQVKANLRSTAEYFAGVGYVIGMLGRFKRKFNK